MGLLRYSRSWRERLIIRDEYSGVSASEIVDNRAIVSISEEVAAVLTLCAELPGLVGGDQFRVRPGGHRGSPADAGRDLTGDRAGT